jgi:hypothetical protein
VDAKPRGADAIPMLHHSNSLGKEKVKNSPGW